MEKQRLGRRLIGLAAWSTVVVPMGVDAVLAADAHMNNPAWLPHAKLHCAMSFFGALGLGIGALWLLRIRPAVDRQSMALAAFLATAFWFGLIASGLWPGATYDFSGDPANYMAPPRFLGVALHMNVAAATLSILAGWAGYVLTGVDRSSARATD